MENIVIEIAKFANNNSLAILLALVIIVPVILIILIAMNVRLNNMNRRYQKMMQGMENENIEKMLLAHVEQVRTTTKRMDEVAAECVRLNIQMTSCIQEVGVVRFNAFENTGSDLSFAIALLDGSNNGVVISSIFARNDSRTYAKPILDGQSTYFLSEEEKEAIAKAQKKNVKK